MIADEEYDYVVAGAGAAGSVVANRLSASGASVLVLEAGGSWIPQNVDEAPLWFTLLGSDIDWGYTSVPQTGLGDRVTYEPRGKVAGGSSNLNIMMHIRGHPSDFDSWAYQGAAGWGYRDVSPYFSKMENHEDRPTRAALSSGPQTITNAGRHNPNPYSQIFLDACSESGYRHTADFNAGQMLGAGWHELNLRDGHRRGALHCYLEPALRDGLTLRTGALATALLFEGDRCIGVEYRQEPTPEPAGPGRRLGGDRIAAATAGRHRARARQEVIVCAGAIETPKLLMLSGIGDPRELRRHGIPVRVALPGVGRNFHNHVLAGVIAETRKPVPAGCQNLSEAALFIASEAGLPAPDLQLAFVHVPFDIAVGQEHPNAVSILPGVVRPASRGWVRLADANPATRPLVNPNYLADSSDLERLSVGMELARDLFATRAFTPVVKGELLPGGAVTDRATMRRFVREHADSYHHQAGSCRMGIDDRAVVDPLLRVFGCTGLRVADASVMPSVPSGNPHATILMIGERCADFIVKEGAGV